MKFGMVYNVQRMSTKDGPGLRTTVFLKGCPLHCVWCSNPESQKTLPQLLYFENLCNACGRCLSVCPTNANQISDMKSVLSLNQCTECGHCATVCMNNAREISGSLMSVEAVMDIIHKDSLFFSNSGGGVTIGGGEPTFQEEFCLALCEAIYQEGFHLTLDTSGFCPETQFRKITKYTNLFLFDCKHMDTKLHKQLTGVENELILKNLEFLFQTGKNVRIRMPLIPHFNDTEENIKNMAKFLNPYSYKEIEIMPYHAFGQSKYLALGFTPPKFQAYTSEELQTVLMRFEQNGLVAQIL